MLKSEENGKDRMVRVSYENWKALMEKKRKFKLKSVDDVISLLLNAEKVRKKKGKERRKLSGKEETKERLIVDFCRFCQNNIEGKCSYEWKGNPLEVKRHKCFVLMNQCIFKAEKEGKVLCAKDFMEKGKIYEISKEECQKCWKKEIELIEKALGFHITET